MLFPVANDVLGEGIGVQVGDGLIEIGDPEDGGPLFGVYTL